MTEHVAEDTWEKLATGELDPAARAEALRHLVGCPRCRTIHRAVRALGDGARAQGLVPPPRRSRIRAWTLGAGVAAAAVAAVTVIAVISIRDADRPERTMRGDGSAAEIVISRPGRIRAGDAIAWSAVAGATGYRVDVFSDDGRPVWDGRTTVPTVACPVLAAGAYRVRVEAIAADGTRAATSPLVAIEVAP